MSTISAFDQTDDGTDTGLPPLLPLAFALRQKKGGGIGVGDRSVLPKATDAAASTPANPVDQARVLPQASAATRPSLGSLASSYDPKIDEYTKQLQQLNQDPDYSALAQATRQRGVQGVQSMGAALAAGMGPQDMQGLQKSLAAQSAVQMAPQKIEGGEIDASGQVSLDPGYKRQKQMENLRESIATLEKQKLGAVTADEKLRAEAMQHDMMNQFKVLALQQHQESIALQAELGRGNLALREQFGGPKMQAHGVTPDGAAVSYSPQTGRTYMADKDGNGLVEYKGPVVSQSTADKQIMAANTIQGADAQFAALEAQIKANPRAFGGVTSLASLTPDIIRSRILNAKLTPAEQEVRANVLRQAAEITHDLYGGALTPGEAARAAGFVPGATDPLETVLTKIAGARAYQQQKLRTLGPWGKQAQAIAGANASDASVDDRKQGYYAK